MIDTLLKKIRRFLQDDRTVQIKSGAVLVLVVLMAVQTTVLGKQGKELAKIRKQLDIISQIPEMEKMIASEDLKKLTPESQIAVIKRILEGTSYRDGIYQAVIDGEVYAVGSEIGDYKIMKITMEAITLENKKRKEVQKLYFPEDSVGGSGK